MFCFRIALMFLSIPPSSVSVERLFSRCGAMFGNSRRSNLHSSTAEKLLLVGMAAAKTHRFVFSFFLFAYLNRL